MAYPSVPDPIVSNLPERLSPDHRLRLAGFALVALVSAPHMVAADGGLDLLSLGVLILGAGASWLLPDLSRRWLSMRVESSAAPEPMSLQRAVSEARREANRVRGRLRAEQGRSRRLEDVVASMDETAVVLEPDGRMVAANPAFLRLLGVEASAMLGAELREHLADPWIQSRVLATGEDGDRVERLVTAYVGTDGTEIPVSFSSTVLRGPDGSVRGYVCVAADIRDRIQVEMSLRDSENRFRDFTETASDWYWEMDADCRFSYFSRRFGDITGTAPDDLLGRTLEQVPVPDIAPEDWRGLLSCVQAREPFRQFVYPSKKVDGTVVWLSTSGTPVFDARGRFAGYRGTGSDVTAHEQTRAELVRSKEASDAATRAKSQFMANVSHEIRTPLNGVLGMLSLLLEDDPQPGQREYLEVAQSSGRALLELVNDVLDLSKIEAGRIEIECIDLDLRALLEDTCEQLAASAAAKGLAFELDVDSHMPPWLGGDPTRLRQVVTNLLSNAIKFTDEGAVAVRARTRPGAPTGTRVQIVVEDTGIGIEHGALDRIFDAFTQADGSTTRRFGGTGLGLSISRQLVQAMGGTLVVDSEPGRGSCFGFTCDLAPARESHECAGDPGAVGPCGPRTVRPVAPRLARVEPAGRCEGERIRVLVVEDNLVNQKVARGLLTKLGCEAEVAGNGEIGLARLAARSFDLVLMDCQMPVLDGYETARRIRAGAIEDRKVPIVALTANAMSGDPERCRKAGMDDYLAKPVGLDELRRKIEQWARRSARRIDAAGDGAGAVVGADCPAPAEAVGRDRGARDADADAGAGNEAVPVPEAAGPSRMGPGAASTDTIDDVVLEGLRDVLGESIGEVIEVFVSEGAAQLESMSRAFSDGDVKTLGRTAHTLKSSSANLGAMVISRLAREIDECTREARLEDARPLLEAAREAWPGVAAALLDRRAPPAAA